MSGEEAGQAAAPVEVPVPVEDQQWPQQQLPPPPTLRRQVVSVAVKIENVDSFENAGEVYVTPKISREVC